MTKHQNKNITFSSVLFWCLDRNSVNDLPSKRRLMYRHFQICFCGLESFQKAQTSKFRHDSKTAARDLGCELMLRNQERKPCLLLLWCVHWAKQASKPRKGEDSENTRLSRSSAVQTTWPALWMRLQSANKRPPSQSETINLFLAITFLPSSLAHFKAKLTEHT